MLVLLRRPYANDNWQRLCLVKSIGHDVRVMVSDSARIDAAVEVVGALIYQRCHCAFIEACLYMDTFARLHLVNKSS